MHKKIILTNIFIILLVLCLSGCLDFLTSSEGAVYESQPVKISYHIEYGYKIICSGRGLHAIKYDCDIPEVLVGTVSNIIALNENYKNINIATFNNMMSWNFTKTVCSDYTLGISANVYAESYMVTDLSGKDALNIQEIQNLYSNLVDQYCQQQCYNSKIFIDSDDEEIKNVASQIYNNTNSDNSFIVAKEIFKWLKQNTDYKINIGNVQQARTTFNEKTGDCDDLSFLYISLCRSLDIPARFIRGYLVEEDTAVAHAWVEVFVGNNLGVNGWIPVECAGSSDNIETEVNTNFAVESANHLRLFKDDGSNESLDATLTGMSYSIAPELEFLGPDAFVEISNYQVLESKELSVNKNNIRTYL